MNTFNLIVSVILGYMLGCVQTAYILGKLVKKIDIRQHGSYNAGASNATIVLGWKFGVITGLVDILKGTLATVLTGLLFHWNKDLMFISGTFAILGHIFPVFLKFKGGKGTASILGVLLAIDYRIALIGGAIIVIVTILTDYIVIGTMVMYAVIIALFLIWDPTPLNISLIVFIALLSVIKHAVNIKRIFKGEETRLRSTFKKK